MSFTLAPRVTAAGVTLLAAFFCTAAPTAAQVQSRMRVLVPDFVNAEGKPTRNGGRLADQVRKLINQTPTHAPLEDKAIREGLKKYGLKESEMDCIMWRQLASQTGLAALVLCGTLDEAAGTISANFHPAGGGDAFEVARFAFQTPEQGAQQVVQSFETYVKQISLVTFCNQDITSQNWRQALDLCSQAIELNPKSVTAHYARGSALTNMDRHEEALAAFERVLELEPINHDALLSAGIVASKLGRNDVSQKYFGQYLELNPGDDNVRLTIASRLQSEGDPAGALRLVEEVASAEGATASLREYAGHYAMSAALAMQRAGPANGNTDQANQYFQKAIEHYQAAVDIRGDSADHTVLRNLMLAYVTVGNRDQAIVIGQRATVNSEDAQAWLIYSDVLRDAGRAQEAIAAVDRAGTLDPTLAGVAFRKTTLLFEAGHLDEAVAAAKAGIAANALPADQAENLAQQMALAGFTHTQAGRNEAALPYFAAAREIGKSERTVGMVNFFNGYTVIRQADAILRDAQTAAPARRAMPMLERARVLLEGAGGYTEQAAMRATLLQQVRQYIDHANALIAQNR